MSDQEKNIPKTEKPEVLKESVVPETRTYSDNSGRDALNKATITDTSTSSIISKGIDSTGKSTKGTSSKD